jgi:hypothetical protein
MANINSAQAKYERNTQGKGGFWKAQVSNAGGRYCQGMSDFLQVNAGALCSKYQAGISAASASSYDQGVAGAGPRWRAGLLRAAGANA